MRLYDQATVKSVVRVLAVVGGRVLVGGAASAARGMGLGMCAGTLVMGATAVSALAQFKDVEPYYGVVSREGATIHCGETDQFYSVDELKQGVVMAVDGESGGWLRVSYPTGTNVILKAEDATFDEATKKATLTRNASVWAPSLKHGFSGSWRKAMATPMAAGSTLTVAAVIKDSSGTVLGYRVTAPEQARAYIEGRNLRRATADEVTKYTLGGGKLPELRGSTSKVEAVATPAATPTPATPIANPASTPAASTPVASTPVPTNSALLDPIKVDGTTPASGTVPTKSAGGTPTPTSTPTSTSTPTPTVTPGDATVIKQGAGDGSATPVVVDGAAPTPDSTSTSGEASTEPRVTPAPRLRLEELDRRFRDAVANPVGADVEYDVLIAEFERAVDEVATAEPGSRRAQQLKRRLDILTLRQQAHESKLKLEATQGDAANRNQMVQNAIDEVAKTRVYTVVGVLQESQVYNGAELPLMYRVQAVGTSTPRTLGYIKPDEKLNMKDMVGKVVGIVGEASVDRSLKLNVITPVVVDVLQRASDAVASPSR